MFNLLQKIIVLLINFKFFLLKTLTAWALYIPSHHAYVVNEAQRDEVGDDGAQDDGEVQDGALEALGNHVLGKIYNER